MNSPKTALRKERRLLRFGSPRTTDGPAPYFARPLVALSFTEEIQTGSALPAHLFRRVDIPLLDGEVARIIEAADAARRIGHDTVPFLAILAPCADRAILLLRLHDPYTPVSSRFPLQLAVYPIFIKI